MEIGHSNRCIPSRGNNKSLQSVKCWNWSCHQFRPCIVKNIYPKYHGNIEEGLLCKTCNEAARRFHGAFEKETEFSRCL